MYLYSLFLATSNLCVALVELKHWPFSMWWVAFKMVGMGQLEMDHPTRVNLEAKLT